MRLSSVDWRVVLKESRIRDLCSPRAAVIAVEKPLEPPLWRMLTPVDEALTGWTREALS